MNLQESVRYELIRYLVQRAIFCPVTSNILDVDTCAVVLDADGDPTEVYDPYVKAKMEAHGDVLTDGYTWMDRS